MTSVQEFFKNVVLGYPFFQKIRGIIDANPNTTFELEARINKIRYISSQSEQDETGWDLEDFTRLKNFLMNFGEPEEQHMTDYTRRSDNLRQTIKQNPDGSEIIYNINKSSFISPRDNDYSIIRNLKDEYGIKMGFSKETKEIPTKELIQKPDLIRVKHRYSWILDKFNIRFDLTKVIQTVDGNTTDKYEIELEMIAPQLQERKTKLTPEEAKDFAFIYRKFSQFIEDVSKILHNSDNFYNRSMINTLATFVNNKLNAQKYINMRIKKGKEAVNNPKAFIPTDNVYEGHISNELFVQARTIKKVDLRDGGLMFGKVRYSVTPKAEGQRRFLVIHNSGLWLFSSGGKNNYCLVYKSSDKEFEDWKKYNETILDGEDIQPDNEEEAHRKGNYPDIKHYYLPFDTLMFKSIDVRNNNLFDRQSYISIIKTVGNTEKLLIEEKPFYDLGTNLETMYSSIEKCLNTKAFNYETDGLIFTPINELYNPQNDVYNDFQRELSRYSDIVKWKPLDKASIDVQIEINVNFRKIYGSNGSKPPVEFTGTDRDPFDPETQIDWYHPLFNKIKTGDIVEFAPKFVEGKLYKNDKDRIVLVPLRIRYDKTYANSYKKTVIPTWREMNDPVETTTLFGKDDVLLRQYHGDIKRELFEKTKYDIKRGSHLIDIGAGRGGDIGKYKNGHFSKILSIEPYEPYYNEFLERLSQKSNDDIRPRITTLMCGGEASQLIIKTVKETFGDELGKVPLTISMMLSLSFFWLNEANMLYQLANTINLIKEAYYDSGGKEGDLRFIFLTIEGERTYNLMTSNNNFVDLNRITLSYFPESETVHIHIPDSIVTEQDEGLVNLYQLRNLTSMDVVYEKEANENLMLSKSEKILSSLYVYGEYVINKSSFVVFKNNIEIPKNNMIIEVVSESETSKEMNFSGSETSKDIVSENKIFKPISRSVSPTRPKIHEEPETIFDKLENLELPIPDELKTEEEKLKASLPDNTNDYLKISIKTGYIDDEGYYVPSESNSTLFECIIKYFNPEAPYVPMNEVIKYRNEMALSIRNTNPFDNANRSIFVSAGKGFLKDVSVNKTDAVSWIASDNELSPPYLVWIPDTIGVNLQVNGEYYLTTRISNELDTIVMKYENKHYRLKI